MKRICVTTLMICLLLLPPAVHAQGYISISEMTQQPPERWVQAYETPWRTIDIDVQPVVPVADTLPILKVVPDFRPLDVSGLGEGWSRREANERSTFGAYLNKDRSPRRESDNTTTTNYYPPFDMNTAYSKNNDMTLGDVILHLRGILTAMGEDREQWQYSQPNRIFINATINLKTGEPMYADSYTVFLNQMLRGIPLLCHVLEGVAQPKDQEMISHTGLSFTITTPDLLSLGGKQVKVISLLADDVPLCDFSKIKTAIEKQIQAGHVRKIFDVELGYALYNEPNIYRKPGAVWLQTAAFYAVPVWRVNCYYIEDAKGKLRDYTGTGVPQRAEIEYIALIINAQTGVVMDRDDNHKGCGDFTGFVSWEDVGGKP